MPRRFRFRLETVLRVRELREREAKRKVGAKLAEIAALDNLNQQAATEISKRQGDLNQSQHAVHLDPRELSSGRAWIAYLRRSIAQRQVAKSSLLSELEQLRAELVTARTQTRILEKLRERKHETWKREGQQREQAEMDEVARRLQLHAGQRIRGA